MSYEVWTSTVGTDQLDRAVRRMVLVCHACGSDLRIAVYPPSRADEVVASLREGHRCPSDPVAAA